jgi:hypothetical protein
VPTDPDDSARITPLPERASVEQLKKRARSLQRAVRAGDPRAVALVEKHVPGRHGALAAFPLDSALLVLARAHGFASWPRLRHHLDILPVPTAPTRPTGSHFLTLQDEYRVRTGTADAADVERCARAATPQHPDPARWRPLLTTDHNGATAIAFATPDGPLFAELTPAAVTLSAPAAALTGGERAALRFHTASGTLAGLVAPGVRGVGLERPADRQARTGAVVGEGVFVVPNAFTVTGTGLIIRVDDARVGEIVPAADLPARATGVVDRPAAPAERGTPAGQRLAAAIAAADAPPVVDPDLWVPGVAAELTAERIQLGRHGRLLAWSLTRADEPPRNLSVFDFGPRRGPVQDFAVRGRTLAATRLYHDFRDGSSDRIAVAGIVRDPAVAAIELRRDGKPTRPARIAGGTFLVAGPDLDQASVSSRSTARLVAVDPAGTVLEDLAYQPE